MYASAHRQLWGVMTNNRQNTRIQVQEQPLSRFRNSAEQEAFTK